MQSSLSLWLALAWPNYAKHQPVQMAISQQNLQSSNSKATYYIEIHLLVQMTEPDSTKSSEACQKLVLQWYWGPNKKGKLLESGKEEWEEGPPWVWPSYLISGDTFGGSCRRPIHECPHHFPIPYTTLQCTALNCFKCIAEKSEHQLCKKCNAMQCAQQYIALHSTALLYLQYSFLHCTKL